MHLTNEVAISGTDQVITWHRNSSPDAGYIVAFLLKNLVVPGIVRGVFWFTQRHSDLRFGCADFSISNDLYCVFNL